MDLHSALVSAKKDLVDTAFTALQRLELEHYNQAGSDVTHQRLDDLYDLMVTAIRDRDLTDVVSYADVVANQPPEELATTIGLVSTVFGCAKDELARRYVSLAAQRHVTSLDLSALFRGVAAN